ncbi:flavodoxin family protein [Brevibacillus gelatini]|nr:flavodoxin domain-containing protein [Brevibacillus gelatini]
MDLTSKAIFYYSITGNTKSLVEQTNTYDFDVINLQKTKPEEVNFNTYDTILIGTPTIGDGIPPNVFKKIRDKLLSIEGKDIGLFGSGNSIYRYYCGALDLIEELLLHKNRIIFKFKFESYPTEKTKQEFQMIIDRICKGGIK